MRHSHFRLPLFFLLFPLFAAVCFLTACPGDGGGGDGGTADAGSSSGSYTLRTETTNFTRNQGGSGAQAVYIDRDSGFTTAVDLTASGAPTGVSTTFEPASPDGNHAILWIDVGTSATTGTHTLIVTGDADGDVQTVDVPLSILDADAEDFGIDASPLTASVAPGNSASFVVDLQWAGGFSDDADLECQDAPTGVTCTFSSNPAAADTDTVTLTMDVGSSTVEDEYPILINGTAGTQMKATAVLLTVDSTASGTPSFTLRSEITNFTFNQEQNGSVILYIDRVNGHSSAVTLTASGAPSGVTIGYEASPSSVDSAIISLDASASATTGDQTISIEGDDGTSTHTTTFPITVNAVDLEDFALAMSALSVNVAAGASGTVDVEVQWAGGFTSSVNLSCNADPAITCAFGTNPVPSTDTTSTITVSVSATAASGTYPVSVEGAGGTQNKLSAFHVVVP
jgi:hypothetical protein